MLLRCWGDMLLRCLSRVRLRALCYHVYYVYIYILVYIYAYVYYGIICTNRSSVASRFDSHRWLILGLTMVMHAFVRYIVFVKDKVHPSKTHVDTTWFTET